VELESHVVALCCSCCSELQQLAASCGKLQRVAASFFVHTLRSDVLATLSPVGLFDLWRWSRIVALRCSKLQRVAAKCNELQRVYNEKSLLIRPTQSIMHVPLQINIFQKSILLIVQYKYLKFCCGDLILQNLILRTRSCGTGFITQSSWIFRCYKTTLVWWKCFVPQLYQLRRGIFWGPALKYFYMMHRAGSTGYISFSPLGIAPYDKWQKSSISSGYFTERDPARNPMWLYKRALILVAVWMSDKRAL